MCVFLSVCVYVSEWGIQKCAEIDNVLHIELTGVSGGALRVNLFNICTDGVIVFSICAYCTVTLLSRVTTHHAVGHPIL